ncbi:hypothetical protein RclHR1_04070015 [Rhizophagus clarus]|uniref:Uncharacterized protein n=1 Tax=Rhizophagus clarus TaxID=94130 RepID=A0A2Z6RJ28_9GLOM|nr:hypothetical protein RclHR1_04070015 [Rhizophagus clarus]
MILRSRIGEKCRNNNINQYRKIILRILRQHPYEKCCSIIIEDRWLYLINSQTTGTEENLAGKKGSNWNNIPCDKYGRAVVSVQTNAFSTSVIIYSKRHKSENFDSRVTYSNGIHCARLDYHKGYNSSDITLSKEKLELFRESIIKDPQSICKVSIPQDERQALLIQMSSPWISNNYLKFIKKKV